MEHLLLSETTIGLKELAIGSARLGDNIIAEDNQASNIIDRRVHGNQDLPFGSQKSGNKMSVYFGLNIDDKIEMNPSITIGRPRPHITRTSMSKNDIFDLVIRVSS